MNPHNALEATRTHEPRPDVYIVQEALRDCLGGELMLLPVVWFETIEEMNEAAIAALNDGMVVALHTLNTCHITFCRPDGTTLVRTLADPELN